MTLAFINDYVYGYYPSSTLREDIRKLIAQYHSISAIFQKNMDAEKYESIPCFNHLSQEIKNKIDINKRMPEK